MTSLAMHGSWFLLVTPLKNLSMHVYSQGFLASGQFSTQPPHRQPQSVLIPPRTLAPVGGGKWLWSHLGWQCFFGGVGVADGGEWLWNHRVGVFFSVGVGVEVDSFVVGYY
jgi:hypothetical protein